MSTVLVVCVLLCALWLVYLASRGLRGRNPNSSVDGFHRALDAMAPHRDARPEDPGHSGPDTAAKPVDVRTGGK